MAIKIVAVVAFMITLMLLLTAASCNKNGTSCLSSDSAYSFSITSEWSTQQEIYDIGDTIFFTSIIPKLLVDNIGGTQINYSDAVSISGTISMPMLDTVTRSTIPARSKFDILPLIGEVQNLPNNPQKGTAYFYQESTSNYICKLGFLCKEKGIYFFSVSDGLSSGLRGKNCTKAGFGMNVTNSDKHFDLYQYALGFMPDADGQRRIYCFRVQ